MKQKTDRLTRAIERYKRAKQAAKSNSTYSAWLELMAMAAELADAVLESES